MSIVSRIINRFSWFIKPAPINLPPIPKQKRRGTFPYILSDKKSAKWIGREVEYRSVGSLKNNQKVFRGRILQVKDGELALVKPFAETDFGVYEIQTIHKEIPHHRYKYAVSYPKRYRAWITYDNKTMLHELRWNGRKWRMTRVI